MKAWLFQDKADLKTDGDKAAWSVGWYDPDRKKRSKKIGAKSRAEKYARKMEGQLEAGVYFGESKKLWGNFRDAFDAKVLIGMEPGTKAATLNALGHFEKVIKPGRLDRLTSERIAEYAAKRRTEKRSKAADAAAVSKATVNKELRHVRAVLRIAHRWGWLPRMPHFAFLKESKRLPIYVTPDHFAAIYGACETATMPKLANRETADWWRGLLMTAYMTGWRINELIRLQWRDVDLGAATAITRADDNKGRRDEQIPLHPVVVAHLGLLQGFEPDVFPWPHDRRTLWVEFYRIQRAAGVTPAGKPLYGFHDLRRAFATMNADRLTPDALQSLMRHKSYQTTQRYINFARQLNRAVDGLYVPDVKPALARG